MQAYRAADAIADKYGYHDLSARIITMMQATAARTGDELLGATTTYVRTESFFASGELATGRKLLERTADAIDPFRSISAAATYESLHMRAAVVAAKEYRPDAARAHFDEAAKIAVGVPESLYFGTAFGPASVRIHQVSLGVEMGDAGAALAAASDWAPPGQVPAERRSHFYIDVARAHMLARQHDNVRAALHEAQSIAPQHTGSHPLVKEMLTLL
ncbi:hypothetical protein [Nocardia pneumoniae]|uniref:hypothetical protein n=1 Tax=Nocardia pneumoniae TaxID=228601 RepID=UPI0002ECD140|nr:hypothetical protein [Nocardia pneumoniae]